MLTYGRKLIKSDILIILAITVYICPWYGTLEAEQMSRNF